MLSSTSLLRRAKKPVKSFYRAIRSVSVGHIDAEDYQMVPSEPAKALAWNGASGWRTRVVVLVLLQVALGLTRENGSRPDLDELENASASSTLHSASASFAALNALELIFCGALAYREMRRYKQGGLENSPGQTEVEAQLLGADERRRNGANDSPLHACSKSSGNPRSNIAMGFLSLLLVTNSYLTLYIMKSGIVGPNLVHLASLFVPFLSAIFLRILTLWTPSYHQWLGIVLQILGILSIESQYFPSDISSLSIILLVPLALLFSLSVVAIQHVYSRHGTSIPNELNTKLFAFGLLAHTLILILSNIFISSPTALVKTQTSSLDIVAFLLRAAVDIASLSVVYDYGAVLFAVSTSLSTTLLLIYSRIVSGSASTTTICSLAIALLGFYAFWTGERQREDSISSPFRCDSEKKPRVARWLIPGVVLSLLGTLVFSNPNPSVMSDDAELHELAFWDTVSQALSPDCNVFAELPYIPSLPEPQALLPPEPTCTRIHLPSEGFFAGNRTYHEFDDVLLIVFFSHARYDVNLDFYKEVYSEFFPNMVFVGPKNREDKGFEHSYDVVVDSYESDEDISDWHNYKMAGRMAHHMLHTVLTTPPYSTNCYKGFLWAPFDTFLNVPRLQLFDKDRLWYFSPWAEYVPNPAINASAWSNASMHAPTARISPDPATDFNKTYRGWWVDWWWGDPHYGIPVCKQAFERVPLEFRERMAHRFTNDTTRYIGGSADTLYVPSRLASNFTDLLGMFLNTSCFLEIAVPTVVHLLVPEDENILFVDHWWIWNPPFNASFVRDRWRRGMEVDTFHTFHWGDKDENGIWRAFPENIEDLRLLFRESAARQGVQWLTLPANTTSLSN